MTRLTDHRRFALATAAVIVLIDLVLAGLFYGTDHSGATAGVMVGGGIALLDVAMLARGLTRFRARPADVGAKALTFATFARFLLISLLVGVCICARGLDPIGVVVGFLLLPLAIVVVGTSSLRAEIRRGPQVTPGRLNRARG